MKKAALMPISIIFLTCLNTFFITPAHATSIISSSPVGGSVLSMAPTAVTITANADLTDGANELTVLDPTGVRVDDGSVQMQGPTLTVGVKPLTVTGVYTVNYTIMAIGENSLTGNITFLFNAPAVVTEPSPNSSVTPNSSTDANSINRTSDLLVIALLVFAIFILILMSRYAKQTFKSTPSPSVKSVKKSSKSKRISK